MFKNSDVLGADFGILQMVFFSVTVTNIVLFIKIMKKVEKIFRNFQLLNGQHFVKSFTSTEKGQNVNKNRPK